MKKTMNAVAAVLLVLTMMVSLFALPAAAAETNLLVNVESNNADGATVTTEGDKVVINVLKPVDAQNNGYGAAIAPRLTNVNVDKDNGGTGFVRVNLEAEVPFRLTMNDSGNGAWVSFAGEFFNVMIPEGFAFQNPDAPKMDELITKGEFFPAGSYKCVIYLGGVYTWKQKEDPAKWDASKANLTAFYLEGMSAGKITVSEFTLTDNPEFESATTPTTAVGDDTSTTAVNGETTTTAANGETTTTTVAVNNPATSTGKLEDLEITMTADKTEYAAGDPISVTMTVKNTSDKAVKNVNLESVIPQGYKLQNGAQNTATSASLEAGKSITLTAVFVEGADDNTGSTTTTTVVRGDTAKNDSPKTADNSMVVLAIVIAVGSMVITMVTVKSGKGKQMLSLALCLTLSISLFAVMPVMTEAAETGSTTVTVNVKANGADLALQGIVSFGVAQTVITTTKQDQPQTTTTKQQTTTTTQPQKVAWTLKALKNVRESCNGILNSTYDVYPVRYSMAEMQYKLGNDASGFDDLKDVMLTGIKTFETSAMALSNAQTIYAENGKSAEELFYEAADYYRSVTNGTVNIQSQEAKDAMFNASMSVAKIVGAMDRMIELMEALS